MSNNIQMTASENVLYAVQQMSLTQKIGQMIMVDFSGYELTDALRKNIAENQWGGIILFAKNVKNRAQVTELCADLQKAAREGGVPAPLFISVDQEGGIVNRIAFAETPVSPGNMALGAAGNPEYAREAARIYGQDLRNIGFNLNFAPCVDINNNPFNPIIGVRSFGESAAAVAEMGVQAARGYRDGGVIPCGKHFPGHGDTATDSHLDLPALKHSVERLKEVELAPFQALIDDKIEMLMTAHITYPALESQPGLPATLSERILSGLLRQEMGFDGVIITDSMSMLAIARNFGVAQAAVMSVQAGADIVLACGTREAQLETLEALLNAVRDGKISEAQVDASVERILSLKEKFLRRPVPPTPDREALDFMKHVARAAITLVKDDAARIPV
ncbi:MAG: beta-N-acetylhexosaminidase, partial [Armatimonadetes bacterium]|nr:beta-N-acetylhexosaminidase [Armatimonadota bacterium]